MNERQREKILKALTQQARRAIKKGAFAKSQNVDKFGGECVYHDGYVSLSLPSDLVETKTVLDIRTKRDIDRGVECIKLDDTTSYPYELYERLDNYKSYEYSVEELLYIFKDLKSDTWVEDDGIITISGNDDEYFNSSGFRFRTLDFVTDGCTAVDVNYLLTVLKVMDILRDKKVTLYLNTRNTLSPIALHSDSVKGDVVPKILGFSW
ncbi:hypothetical protein ABZ143_002829 [Listeria monocytogenes]